MVKVRNDNFNIEQIAKSGQCFRLAPNPNEAHTWTLIAYDKLLDIKQEPNSNEVILFCSQQEFDELWKYYFDLDTDYGAYIECVPPDDIYLTRATQIGSGIRILNQEPWEMMVSFMISQNNNIPRIKHSIELLCQAYGEKNHTSDGRVWFSFPKACQLMEIEKLQNMGLGYRDKYIQQLAESVCTGKLNIQDLKVMTDNELRTALLSMYGIGTKVANCIMLFGFHRIASFPKDVWIKRIIEQQYGGHFSTEPYKGFEGVIQQYIFYYAMNKLDLKDKADI